MITDTINAINANIKASLTCRANLQGLAEPCVIRKEGKDSIQPLIAEPNGKAHSLLIDSGKDDIISYHKINGIQYTETRTGGYGNDARVDAVYDMALIMCGKRTSLEQYAAEDIVAKAIRDAGATLASSSFDKAKIWQAEYSGYAMPLPLNLFLIKTSYKVTIKSNCSINQQ